jgi:hypothetical protein
MTSGKSDLIDLTLEMVFETEKAICVYQPVTSRNKDALKKVWLPKSLIEYEPKKDRISVDVTLPEWLAHREGLI